MSERLKFQTESLLDRASLIADWWLPGTAAKAAFEPKTVIDRLGDGVWAVKNPEDLFGSHKVYHVTTDFCLPWLADGKPLLSPMTHDIAGIITHRKQGLHYLDALLSALGIDMSGKRAMLFAGQQVDPEQVIIEDRIGSQPEIVEKQLAKKFTRISSDYIGMPRGYYTRKYSTVVSEVLNKLFEMLDMHRRVVSPTRTQQKHYQDLLDTLFSYTGVREGWYEYLQSILEGKRSIGSFSYAYATETMREAISFYESCVRNSNVPLQAKTRAVAIEIDQLALNHYLARQSQGFVPIAPPNHRDSMHIRSMPQIPAKPGIITAMYHIDPVSVPGDLRVKLERLFGIDSFRSLHDLPKEKHLGFRTVQEVLDAGGFESLTPTKALCDTRYNGFADHKTDPVSRIRDVYDAGMLLPLFDTNLTPIQQLHMIGISDAESETIDGLMGSK